MQGKDLLVLHEGTKVRVLEEAGEWARIELEDGRQGWLLLHEILLYIRKLKIIITWIITHKERN